ncbi:MAG: hypothetical protein IKD08_02815 [Alphaproteobacteria bacterium]|nr:hypothetical protein [Alphaproteobacteria bacterium]
MRFLLSAFLGLGLLCSVASAAENPAALTLKVKNVEVISDYAATGADNIDGTMKPSPKETIRQWLESAYLPEGKGTDTAKFIIKSASITEELVKSESFFSEDAFKYKANFILEIEIIGADNKIKARAITKSWGVRTVSTETTITEREKIWQEMVHKLLENLATQTDNEMKNGFKEYLKP